MDTTLTTFELPCSTCNRMVTIRSDNPTPWLNAWLDKIIAVYCPAHRHRGDDT